MNADTDEEQPDQASLCSICTESLLPTEGAKTCSLRVCAQCGYVFHMTCLEKWKSQMLKNKKDPSCPNCRTEFIGKKAGLPVHCIPVDGKCAQGDLSVEEEYRQLLLDDPRLRSSEGHAELVKKEQE
ncbi:unnamed protein product, partial [Amoebophrya sp. A120]|eukprot:GSA120T00017093001.1